MYHRPRCAGSSRKFVSKFVMASIGSWCLFLSHDSTGHHHGNTELPRHWLVGNGVSLTTDYSMISL